MRKADIHGIHRRILQEFVIIGVRFSARFLDEPIEVACVLVAESDDLRRLRNFHVAWEVSPGPNRPRPDDTDSDLLHLDELIPVII